MRRKILLLIILGVCVFYAPSILAVDITGCESVLSGVVIDVKIPNAVHTIITVIKIAVPVILVVFGMMDLLKGIMQQKEDEIKKGQQLLIKRIIAAALVFFVISIVQVVISFVADSSDEEGFWDCVNCFLRGADESTGNCN